MSDVPHRVLRVGYGTTVFVSSRFEEFAELRAELRAVVQRLMPAVVLLDLNDGNADGRSPRRRSLDGVKSADFVLLLLGAEVGSTVDSGRSIVEEEFDEALEQGCEIHSYVRPGVTDPKALSLLARVQESTVVGTLTDHLEIDAAKIAQALMQWLLIGGSEVSDGNVPRRAIQRLRTQIRRLGIAPIDLPGGPKSAEIEESLQWAIEALDVGRAEVALHHLGRAEMLDPLDWRVAFCASWLRTCRTRVDYERELRTAQNAQDGLRRLAGNAAMTRRHQETHALRGRVAMAAGLHERQMNHREKAATYLDIAAAEFDSALQLDYNKSILGERLTLAAHMNDLTAAEECTLRLARSDVTFLLRTMRMAPMRPLREHLAAYLARLLEDLPETHFRDRVKMDVVVEDARLGFEVVVRRSYREIVGWINAATTTANCLKANRWSHQADFATLTDASAHLDWIDSGIVATEAQIRAVSLRLRAAGCVSATRLAVDQIEVDLAGRLKQPGLSSTIERFHDEATFRRDVAAEDKHGELTGKPSAIVGVLVFVLLALITPFSSSAALMAGCLTGLTAFRFTLVRQLVWALVAAAARSKAESSRQTTRGLRQSLEDCKEWRLEADHRDQLASSHSSIRAFLATIGEAPRDLAAIRADALRLTETKDRYADWSRLAVRSGIAYSAPSASNGELVRARDEETADARRRCSTSTSRLLAMMDSTLKPPSLSALAVFAPAAQHALFAEFETWMSALPPPIPPDPPTTSWRTASVAVVDQPRWRNGRFRGRTANEREQLPTH